MVVAMVIRMAGATGVKKEQAEALLGHQALHDMLTGLPNRSCFYDRTDQAMRQGARDGSNSAVMLFDLDRFKEINDTLGHKYGDRVLSEVGPRINQVLRDARHRRPPGWRRVLRAPSARRRPERRAARWPQRIIAVLGQPLEIDGMVLGIEASCGIAMAPDDGDNADLLLQRADVAMYVAKGSNVNVVAYTRRAQRQHPGPADPPGRPPNGHCRRPVRPALPAQGGPELTGRCRGWRLWCAGSTPPSDSSRRTSFIPVAEHTGLIKPLTSGFSTKRSASAGGGWTRPAPGGPGELSMAINLSTRSLLDDEFPDEVEAALDRWDIPPICSSSRSPRAPS